MLSLRLVKGQMLSMDLIASTIIFSLAIVLYLVLGGNLSLYDANVFEALVADVESIHGSLLSAGSPENWTAGNVTTIGLTDGSFRLSREKILRFMNLSPGNATGLFGTNSNYAVFFRDSDGNVVFFDRCVFSNAGLDVQNISLSVCENVTLPDHGELASSERIAYHNLTVITVVVYAWRT